MKTIIVKITKSELDAIREMVDDCESTIGSSEPLEEGEDGWDEIMEKRIKKIRNFFKKNNIQY